MPRHILDKRMAEEAKALVALAFRNGPTEDVHTGRECPTCAGRAAYSRITQREMKRIIKKAVDKVYALLWIRTHCPEVYGTVVKAGCRFATDWDAPERCAHEIESLARFTAALGAQ